MELLKQSMMGSGSSPTTAPLIPAPPAPTGGMAATSQKRLTASWDIIKRTIPNFGEDMLRRKVCAEIQTGMRGARGDNCGSLKTAVTDYLLPVPPPPAPATPDVVALPAPLPKLDPPIPTRGSKAHRGMNHPATSAAIRTLKYTDEPATYEAIKAGDKAFPVLGTQLPAFLYKWGQVYNPDDLDAGLLEGHTFRYCAKHIYKGPGSALEGPGANKGKGGNADINGVTALTDRDMGYVACQARFAMSSVESWSEMDGEFSYVDFYWKVVELLRGEEGEEILDRFNLEVFGTRTTSSRKLGANSVADDEFAILEAQRAEKRARRMAAAAAGEST
ncbi:hypothetical protein C8R44DRAFT_747756 [Mycena epipterygia]|nr:hypothetical protein C8R44DRAFT_747756 [Mycena epipterygia]